MMHLSKKSLLPFLAPVLAPVAVLISALPSFAVDNPPGRDAAGNQEQVMKNGPCASDIQTYCSDVTPGRGRIMACLKAHDDKLSSACLRHEQAMVNQFREVRKACHSDVQKFCKDVKPGVGDVMRCLKQHEADLSQTCKNELPPESTG